MLMAAAEICDTRGSRWKYIGVYGRSWKLPPNVVVEKLQLMEAMEAFTSTTSENSYILP